MASAVLARDPDTVLDMWRMQDSPFFAVFEGKKEILYRHAEDDMISAEAKLRETLDYIAHSNSNAEFTIRIYDDGDKITNAKPYRGTVPFRLAENGYRAQRDENGIYVLNQPMSRQQPLNSVDQKLDKLIELLTLQQTKVIEAEEIEEDEEDQEPEISEEEELQRRVERWTTIGTQIGNAITPLLTTILDRLKPVEPNISGMPQQAKQPVTDEQLQLAIRDIINCIGQEEFNRVMVALGRMANENPAQLQGLIKMVN